jgi:ribosomal protein L29
MSESAKKTKIELEKELHDKRVALRDFRFSMSGGKVKNVREGRKVRREIARALTALAVIK